MKKKYDELVNSVIDLIGGKDNIISFTHCVTRLRFNLKDTSIPDVEKINKLTGVIGTSWQNNQLQIIVGQIVNDVYEAICDKYGLCKEGVLNENVDENKKKNIFVSLIEVISGCVIPLVPILMGAGMMKVFYLLAVQFNLLNTDSSTYIVLDFVNNSAFYFLPIFVGGNFCKKIWS